MTARLIDIPNACLPFENVLAGGQPTPEDLAAAKDAGYRTIVNLRPLSEQRGWDEAKTVEDMGMRYVHIPIASAHDLNDDTARRLADAVKEGDTMVHCASGNRVGGLLAIKAKLVDGESPAQALETGKRAGLTSMESDVRQLLET